VVTRDAALQLKVGTIDVKEAIRRIEAAMPRISGMTRSSGIADLKTEGRVFMRRGSEWIRNERSGDCGLDVGSSQVTTVLGRKTQDGVEILGMGECPTEGMRRGAVVNVDATVKSIRQSVTEAERMTGLTVESVFVGISGPLIKSFNSHAAISVKNEHEVTDADFTRVLEIARTVELPNDREILHVLTQEFIVDDMAGIRIPGNDGHPSRRARPRRDQRRAGGAKPGAVRGEGGPRRRKLRPLPLASAEAVLTPEEREVGVALMDFGGGTVEIVIFFNGSLRHTYVLPSEGAASPPTSRSG